MPDAEQFVDVRYRGLPAGERLKLCEVAPSTAYLEMSQPLPVGAELICATDAGLEISLRVIRVQEQVAGAPLPPGMRVRVGALEGDAKGWWDALISAEDPVIPEPGAAPAAEAGGAEEAAPAAADAAVAADEGKPADGGKKRRRQKTKMGVGVEAAEAADATAEAKDANDAKAAAADSSGRDEASGKRKRRRRRRKSTSG